MGASKELSPEVHSGTLVEANNNSRTGIISEKQKGDFPRGWVFTFDQIEGYKDQTVRGMGLLPGTEVCFSAEANQRRILSITFPFIDHYRRILGFKYPLQDYFDGF